MAALVRSEPGPKFDRATSTASGVLGDSGNRASGSLGNEYCYSPLPHGSIRLLRLMPHKDKEAPIRCQLFEYPLQEPGQGIHLYEALSYVWGSQENKQPIHVQSDDATPSTGNGHCLLVTANLYEALSRLRNRLLERVIWIDAVCINQEDNDEKGRQVQSMAKIYANANRVIVWLGEATDNGDQALETIRMAAQEQHMDSAIYQPDRQATFAQEPMDSGTNQQAILKLLERPWFQRIWVLQEVAAARNILVKCGSVEIDGYVFCLGMDALKPYRSSPELSSLIRPVAYLIRGAGCRPTSESGPARFSLGIRPLSELVDMYHGRKAMDRRDKVYALLGMSLDDPNAAELSANYETPWKDVFQKLIRFCLSDQVSISTWDTAEVAVVEAKGYVLGEVASTDEHATWNDRQALEIVWKCPPSHSDGERNQRSRFTFQASAKTIKKGDVVCLLKGAPTPTILRLRNGFSTVVMVTLPRTDGDGLPKWVASTAKFLTDLLLVWDWDESRKSQGEDYGDFISGRGVPECSKTKCGCQNHLDEAARWLNLGMLLHGIERHEKAARYIQKAAEVYSIGTALRSDPGHVRWRKEDEKALRAMDELLINDGSAIIRAEYGRHCHTPLRWAVTEGCEAFARLLIEGGADIKAKNGHHEQTLLHFAAEKGREGVARLLVEAGADKEAENGYGCTPLHVAAENGHEAVARLLVEAGADKEAESGYGRPLHLAAQNGHEAVARLLVEAGADKEAKNGYGCTPLHVAAENGHEAVARLLVEAGADKEAENGSGCTGVENWYGRPLHLAVQNGHEAVTRLLVEAGADKEAENWYGRTPLHVAARNGREAVARLLVEAGANKEAESWYGRPLHLAAQSGHEGVARLLVEAGADKEAESGYGRTPLHLAAENGHKAVARLLVEAGANKEAENGNGCTPLHRPA